MFTPNTSNYLIPLEVIYRNGLPEGSSIFKRLERALVTIEELGLDHYPRLGEKLSSPILDVSTKLEEKDRYVTWVEAGRIAGLTDEEVGEVKALLLSVDETITHIASKAGLENEDGKIELAFDVERRLMIVDVVGTLDECRFTYERLDVGKEIARRFYRKTSWHRDVEEAKERAATERVKDWRRLCQSSPPKLDQALKVIISEMYLAAANELTDRKLFDVPSLVEVIKKYRDYVVTD
jgi:phosphoribosylaminoimidazole-succinocarboxamide synthase